MAISSSGLAAAIGEGVSGLDVLPLLLLVLTVILIIVFLTEITSNTATTAAVLPILATVAITMGYDPMLLAVPAAIAASCAFMLPVATPPNAVVYASGQVAMGQMVRAGVWLNLMAVALLPLAALTLAARVLG